MIEDNTLVGRIRIAVGDLVLLRGADTEAAGYVVKLEKDTVRLSHRNPALGEATLEGCMTLFTGGDRSYSLRYFTEYKVLLRAEEVRDGCVSPL
ncbi:hypothetical protein HYZ97_01235 [Candidatus Pacearchaeota archaeon]|nr:hypothetical protein [Candidatus Pacearchaeota archaeon]